VNNYSELLSTFQFESEFLFNPNVVNNYSELLSTIIKFAA